MEPSMDMSWMGVGELARAIRERTLSPVEVMEGTLARVRALQPTINAFITVVEDAAMSGAREAEAAVMSGEPLGPLHGVPFSVKDLVATAGVRTTMGSFIHERAIPDKDALAVKRLKDAGAILIGKTTTSEFGHKPFTDAPLFGITRNPWNLERTAGGSSGGAAAAVTSGQGPLALGTDGGGSIRIPASCCGIVGLKPTLGRIPNPDAPDLFATLAYTGPMARTVADVRIAFEVLDGPDERDPYAQYTPSPAERPTPELSKLRLAWLPKVGNPLVARDVLARTEHAVRQLERQGAAVETIEIDCAAYEDDLLTFVHSKMRLAIESHLAKYGDRITPSLRESAARGLSRSGADYQRALMRRTELTRVIQRLFERFDFLVMPTLSRTAPMAEADEVNPISVDGAVAGMVRAAWYPYTFPFNFSGHPAVSTPCGLSSDLMPVGLQIVGRWNADLEVLALAEIVEREHPYRRPPSAAA